MLRLKKTVTKQTPAVLAANRPAVGGPENNAEPGKPLNHMEALQMKIRNRFKALRPQRQQEE